MVYLIMGTVSITESESSHHSSNSSHVEKEIVDIDEFLIRSGECGQYQFHLIILIKLLTFPLSFSIFVFYFIGIDPSWVGNTDMRIHNKDDKLRCSLNRTDWVYSYSKSTLVTEYDLVCGDSWILAVVGSSVFVGWAIGSIVMGYLSDKYGRKAVMLPTAFFDMFCLFLHGFVKSVWLLVFVRFMIGFFHAGTAMNSFILLVEFIGPNCRVLATNIAGTVWVIGSVVLAFKAYFIDDWRILCIVCSAPYFFVLIFGICLPESIRWLNATGRKDKAESILQYVAKMNGREDMTKVSITPVDTAAETVSYLDLFKDIKATKIVISQAFLWFIVGMSYYTFSWAFADLGGDLYINFVLSVVVEIPMHVVAVVGLQMFGRKKTTIVSFIVTCIACLAVSFLTLFNNTDTFRLVFGLAGKSTAALSFMCIYMWSAEIYPTVVRTQGMGINVTASRVGAATSPFVKMLDHIHPSIPFVVMTVSTFLAFITCFVLPETLDKATRETLDELTQDD